MNKKTKLNTVNTKIENLELKKIEVETKYKELTEFKRLAKTEPIEGVISMFINDIDDREIGSIDMMLKPIPNLINILQIELDRLKKEIQELED